MNSMTVVFTLSLKLRSRILEPTCSSTREGMAIAKAKGKLRGKQPKLTSKQQRELRRMYDNGNHSISDLAEVFAVSRSTVYRTLARNADSG